MVCVYNHTLHLQYIYPPQFSLNALFQILMIKMYAPCRALTKPSMACTFSPTMKCIICDYERIRRTFYSTAHYRTLLWVYYMGYGEWLNKGVSLYIVILGSSFFSVIPDNVCNLTVSYIFVKIGSMLLSFFEYHWSNCCLRCPILSLELSLLPLLNLSFITELWRPLSSPHLFEKHVYLACCILIV